MNATTTMGNPLISSDKVEGTAVYGVDKEKIGVVKEVVLGKMDGKVHHVILSVGGFLGMGDQLHSLPWEKLDYDTSLDGYKLSVTKEQLKSSPSYDGKGKSMADDRDYQAKSFSHYGVSPTW